MGKMDLYFSKNDMAYYDYIVEHKKNVMIAFNLLMLLELSRADKVTIDKINTIISCRSADEYRSAAKMVTENISINTLSELRDRVLIHDLSKFSKEEFDDYRKTFYSKDENEKNNANFESAWIHHYTNNSHHPEHFTDGNMMTYIDTLEMVLDLCAMSIKFGNNPYEYFCTKRDKIKSVVNMDFIENTIGFKELGDLVLCYINNPDEYSHIVNVCTNKNA